MMQEVAIATVVALCLILYARMEQRRMDRRDRDEYLARTLSGRDA